MNPTIMKIAFAYIAGFVTFSLYQESRILDDTQQIVKLMSSSDFTEEDSSAFGHDCACDNEARYNVTPIQNSQNIAIPNVADCKAMVPGPVTAPSRPEDNPAPTTVGAWFSKITLDNMFCHMPDANGIYVYNATDPEGQPTYIIEAGRNNMIESPDDGTSTIYYSRALCPTICGACGI